MTTTQSTNNTEQAILTIVGEAIASMENTIAGQKAHEARILDAARRNDPGLQARVAAARKRRQGGAMRRPYDLRPA